jgi:2-oxoglutarate dehydrogenase E2 component (dihydrolipoamide succinyltransferase)
MIEHLSVPQIGESISEAQVSKWLVVDGQLIEKDQDVVEIDSDKTTLTVSAPISGKIKILIAEGTMVAIGQTIAEIDAQFSGIAEDSRVHEKDSDEHPLNDNNKGSVSVSSFEKDSLEDVKTKIHFTPLARSKMLAEGINPEDVYAHVMKYRIGVSEVEDFKAKSVEKNVPETIRRVDRKPMSPLRRKLAKRLVAVKNQTAMLTTFNEIDMTNLMELRNKYKEEFQIKHGVKLGFMSFFARACALALKQFPSVNAMIDGDDVVFYNYADISIAVSTEKGLVVPVVRNVEVLSIPKLETEIGRLAEKARSFKLLPEDIEGGTFTITNGGVFGSLLSTPIINPPQTAILGMHTIQERPVAINGKVEIRPMMYIALSYDHRIIDGKESVGFVIEVKRLLENPELLHGECSDKLGKMLDL